MSEGFDLKVVSFSYYLC